MPSDPKPPLRLIGCSQGELVLARPSGSVVRVQLSEADSATLIAQLANWLRAQALERASAKGADDAE